MNYSLTRSSFDKLQPGKWLNDEIINAYIKLINARSAQRGLKNAYVLNTFFFTLIEQMLERGDYQYSKLQRTLKRLNVKLDEYSLTVIPINVKNNHWLCAGIDLRSRTVYIIDSLECHI